MTSYYYCPAEGSKNEKKKSMKAKDIYNAKTNQYRLITDSDIYNSISEKEKTENGQNGALLLNLIKNKKKTKKRNISGEGAKRIPSKTSMLSRP